MDNEITMEEYAAVCMAADAFGKTMGYEEPVQLTHEILADLARCATAAAARTHVHADKTEPVYETTNYIFTAPIDHEFSEDRLNRIIEGFRAYAYPSDWGYTTLPYPDSDHRMFRCEFEIQARERGTAEYLEGVRNEMLTWFGDSYVIVKVEA